MQKNVIEYLSETVGRFPEKTAVKDSEMSITFAELWQNAQKISSALINTNIGLRNPIGVYIPKGCKMIEAFAGINLSGNFYVPLDTKSPASRIESIISTLEAKVLITDRTHLSSLRLTQTQYIVSSPVGLQEFLRVSLYLIAVLLTISIGQMTHSILKVMLLLVIRLHSISIIQLLISI